MPNDSELKNRVRFSSTLSIDVNAKLKSYSTESGVPISKILDKAITAYLDSVSSPNKQFF